MSSREPRESMTRTSVFATPGIYLQGHYPPPPQMEPLLTLLSVFYEKSLSEIVVIKFRGVGSNNRI